VAVLIVRTSAEAAAWPGQLHQLAILSCYGWITPTSCQQWEKPNDICELSSNCCWPAVQNWFKQLRGWHGSFAFFYALSTSFFAADNLLLLLQKNVLWLLLLLLLLATAVPQAGPVNVSLQKPLGQAGEAENCPVPQPALGSSTGGACCCCCCCCSSCWW
jgi:heme A synthase